MKHYTKPEGVWIPSSGNTATSGGLIEASSGLLLTDFRNWFYLVLPLHTVGAFALAALVQDWLPAIILSVPVWGLYTVAAFWKPQSHLTRITSALALLAFTALHTYQLQDSLVSAAILAIDLLILAGWQDFRLVVLAGLVGLGLHEGVLEWYVQGSEAVLPVYRWIGLGAVTGVASLLAFSIGFQNKEKQALQAELAQVRRQLERKSEDYHKLQNDKQQQEKELENALHAQLHAVQEMERINQELKSRLEAIDRSVAVIEFDPNGTILTANTRFLRLMEYELAEIISKHHRIFVQSAESENEAYARFWRDLKDGLPKTGEFQRITKSGNTVYLHGAYSPIQDATGKTIRVVKYVTDLTEMHRQAEMLQQTIEEVQTQQEELRASSEQLEALQLKIQNELQGQLNALHNGAIVSEADLRGDIIFVNDLFVRISRYSRSELMGQNHRLLKSGHQDDAIFVDLWRTISQGQVWKGIIKNRAKDGSYYWVYSTITPALGIDNKPTKYIAVRYDITEIKQKEEELAQLNASLDRTIQERTAELQHMLEETQTQEEELRASSEQLEALQLKIQNELQGQLNALHNGAIVSEADLKGDIIFVNDLFVRISRYSKSELMGQNHRLLKSGHQDNSIFVDLWQTISRGQVWKGIIKNRAKDGSYYWVYSTITPALGIDNKPTKYIAVRYDITEIKQKEEELAQLNTSLDRTIQERTAELQHMLEEAQTQE
jgi:PAS domain S-box-containing protein